MSDFTSYRSIDSRSNLTKDLLQMSATKKTISRETHLMALALFTMAQEHAKKSRAFEVQLTELLGYEDTWAGCLSDEIYDPNGRFEVGLARDGYVVASPKQKAAAKKKHSRG